MGLLGLFYTLRPQMSWPWWLGAFVLGAVLAVVMRPLRKRGRLSAAQAAAAVVLGIYLFLVLSYTVFSRNPSETYTYKLEPFWSFQIILNGGRELLVEAIYNILMLMPVGMLLPVILTRPGASHVGLKTIGGGFLCSVTIELLQLVTKRGLCEVNDVLNNTFGAAIGFGLFCIVHSIYKKRRGARR